jgi:ABC-type Mn2+/Zn2+ transport system ATPase subunit
LGSIESIGWSKKKVVLARTKVYGSKLLLIDEGTLAIDEKATLKILKNILQGPETIVFIAHNWSKELHDLFDREIYLQDNK